jgi:prolyl oligopeptidase
MRWFFLFFIMLLCCNHFAVAQDIQKIVYPTTEKGLQVDDYFGCKVEDPYRWLEEQGSVETKNWVKEQNSITRDYLDKIPKNFTLREQIKRNTEVHYLTPEKKGNYYFELRTKYSGKELVIYFKKDFLKDYWDELFITKNLKIANGESISISEYEVSNNSKYIAYTFDRNGSDWKELKVADLEKQKELTDHLFDIKHTSIVWRGAGFYYTKYERTSNEDQYKQLTLNGKLYYHKLGTTQDKDSLIFKKSGISNNLFSTTVTSDERFLIINDHDPVKSTNAYYYYDFNNSEQKSLLPLFKKSEKYFSFTGFENDSLFFTVKTNGEKKVIAVNPKNPLKWVEKVKDIDQLKVLSVIYHKGYFYKLAYYNQQQIIVVFSKTGQVLKKIEIPFGASCDFKGVDENVNQLLLSYGSYFHPPIYAAMDLSTFKFKLLETAKISYDMDSYEIKRVLYKSDTSYVPMLLMHKKNIQLDGRNPVLIEFYGGFGTIHNASYDAGKITFLENGGVYAYAMIRGGGEKGQYWHNDAKLEKRQNSVNDIINAAKYLIEKKYTVSSKIAITGGSHGGLMTCIAAIQHPDLFAAAVPKVAVCDMLRFEKFTIGTFHTDEYGTVNDSMQFTALRKISPLHNVKNNVKYPSMLFMTSDYDDRVPPLHSYKMVATLQELASKENPVLLRVEKNAGHNGARNYNTYIDKTTDFYSFILNALEVKPFK